MVRLRIPVLLLIVLMLMYGCDQLRTGHRGVAGGPVLLDFPALLKATGMDGQVQGQLQDAGRILDQQIEQATKDLGRQVADARTAAGEKPTPAQLQELETLTAQANQQLNQVRQNAQLKLQQVRAGIIAQLRDQVRPIAQAIAVRHGASTVMLSSDAMLWFDPQVDITAEVIAEARIHPLTLAPLPTGSEQVAPVEEKVEKAGSNATGTE